MNHARSFSAAAALLLISLLVVLPPTTEASHSPPVPFVVGIEIQGNTLPSGASFHGARILGANPQAGFVVVEARFPWQFLERARADAHVRYVAYDDPFAFRALFAPNDPRVGDQHALSQVRAPEAWDTTRGAKDVILAVVDSGIDAGHPDLGRLLAGRDFTGEGDLEDRCGHGTHVAGIAAATTDNGLGVAGLAQVSVLPVKVLAGNCGGSFSGVANGITWAADEGARVISLSLGCDGCHSQAVVDAIEYAVHAKGALVVAAAGNGGPCGDCVNFPASHPDVVAVTCLTATDARCGSSAQGAEAEIAAPGWDVLSTVRGGGYGYKSGTSMAAPHVSGVAGLLWSVTPGLTNGEVREILQTTARDLGPGGRDASYGYGALDAKAALDGVGEAPPTPPPPPAQAPVMQETFDDGTANVWALSGLWHVASTCVTAASPPNHLAYTRTDACSYDTGSRTSGSASFDVDLTGGTVATFAFKHRWETESYANAAYDAMRVEASTDGGGTWTLLRQWDSRDANAPDWRQVNVDLDAYAGAPLGLRFHFDTADRYYNGYSGWFLDDVVVTSDAGREGDGVPNEPPVAGFTSDCPGLSCSFDATASTDPDGVLSTYAWDFGDGSTAAGATVSHAYAVGGEYAVTLTVTDDAGATGATKATVIASRPGALLAEDFEDAAADGWTLTGLWRVGEDCLAAGTGSKRLQYNDPVTCTYDVGERGSRSAGAATFTLDLTPKAHPRLNFTHAWDVEHYEKGAYDVMRVQVSTNGGASWTTLKQWDSRQQSPGTWERVSLDLAPYKVTDARIRFHFDTVDGHYNRHPGWAVDDVRVS